MAYEHQIKASKIKSTVVRKPDENVYGLSFELDGNVASPFQFYLTDSTTHFLRGSLYFESKPNQDSLKPVLEHVKKDFVHFFRTFHWD
jgi:gliding motility-associated lipoprotein GldD